MNLKIDFTKAFFCYLSILFIFAVFFLFQKHTVGNDSTISEWLINYEGGFTKRGIIGQISIYLSYIFELTLRESILLFQIFIVAIYYLLLFLFFKDFKVNNFVLLAIFSPIFILYPVAEIEVLARKEFFIFSAFLVFLLFRGKNIRHFSRLFIFPITVLIYEPVILFLPFWIMIDMIEKKIENFNSDIIILISPYIPSIFVAFYIAFNPMGDLKHDAMANFLAKNFNEVCYMSCAYLKTKSSILAQFTDHASHYSFEVFFRYSLIILIGFGPLFLLAFFSKLRFKNILFFNKFKNNFFILIFILSPGFLLFAMGYDWGRWVNINYSYAALFYLYIIKNDHVYFNQNKIDQLTYKFFSKKKFFVFFFIIFCFGWNPKTVMTGDVASFPGYRIPYKTFKIIKNKYIKNHSTKNSFFIKKLS